MGSLKPRATLRITPLSSTDPTDIPMPDIPMPVSMVDTLPPTDMDTEAMVTERGLLMPSPRLMLRLTLLSSTDPTDIPMPVSMVDTEPMVPTPLPMDMATEPMEPTLILTTERGLLMLSLTPLSSMDPTDIPMLVSMVDTEPMVPTPLPTDMDTEPMEPTPILTMERGLLMLSPRLTPLSSTPPPMLSPP